MSPLDSFITLAAAVGCLWGLWLLLNFVFDCIEDYHEAWREERYAADRARAEDLAKLREERETFG